MTDIETEIPSWRKALKETAHLPDDTIQELEDHLRSVSVVEDSAHPIS